MDVRRLVSINVRRLRLKAGLTQAELAERLGVDRAYISGLESGQRNPTIVTLWHVSLALDVTLTALVKEHRGFGRKTRGDGRPRVSKRE